MCSKPAELVVYNQVKRCLELTDDGRLAEQIVWRTRTHTWLENAFEHGSSPPAPDRDSLTTVAALVTQLADTIFEHLSVCVDQLGAPLSPRCSVPKYCVSSCLRVGCNITGATAPETGTQCITELAKPVEMPCLR